VARSSGSPARLPPRPQVQRPLRVGGFHLRPRGSGAAARRNFTMSAPRPHWFEHPLGQHLDALFVLDVDLPAPPSLRAWLDEPLTTRGLPRAGPPPASAAAAQPVVRHHRPHPTGHDRWTGY